MKMIYQLCLLGCVRTEEELSERKNMKEEARVREGGGEGRERGRRDGEKEGQEREHLSVLHCR